MSLGRYSGQLGGPGQIRHVVELDLIVQGQRVIPLAPDVAHPRALVHDQRIYAQKTQPGRDGKSCLPRSHDQDGGIAIGEG